MNTFLLSLGAASKLLVSIFRAILCCRVALAREILFFALLSIVTKLIMPAEDFDYNRR